MVILQKIPEKEMPEKEMDNRGSKSVIWGRELQVTVKEQRIDGSYICERVLRCVLVGLERGYPVRILSYRISSMNYRYYSTNCIFNPKIESPILNP